jgi:arsenate reductase-like glutaredoxin family protein
VEALQLIAAATQLRVAKGQKVVAIDLQKDKPAEAELLKLVLGPTGNLRAPTLRVGKTLIVGFNAEMYEQAF